MIVKGICCLVHCVETVIGVAQVFLRWIWDLVTLPQSQLVLTWNLQEAAL